MQRARRFFTSRLFPKYSSAILRENEEAQKQVKEVRDKYEHEIERLRRERDHAINERDSLEGDLIIARDSAAAWEQTANDVILKLNEQAELNATLLQQGFGVEVQLAKHSATIDRLKFQVLTQFTGRNFNIKRGLLGALHDAFSLNVARHIINKLAKGDFMSADEPISEEEYSRQMGAYLEERKQFRQLPPSSR